MLGNFFEKRRQNKILEKYVSKDVADAIVAGKPLPNSGIQAGRIELVLAFVRGDSVEQNSERMALVCDLAIKHGWTVYNMISSLVVIASDFGLIANTQPSASSRMSLVNELHQQLGSNTKIVHGATEGHFGNFGSSKRLSYTFVVPKFDVALARLGQIEFGKAEEFAF